MWRTQSLSAAGRCLGRGATHPRVAGYYAGTMGCLEIPIEPTRIRINGLSSFETARSLTTFSSPAFSTTGPILISSTPRFFSDKKSDEKDDSSPASPTEGEFTTTDVDASKDAVHLATEGGYETSEELNEDILDRPLASSSAMDSEINLEFQNQGLTEPEIAHLSNEQLEDTSTIPGFELVTTKPRRYPRGSLLGHVVSTKMQKTVTVAVKRFRIVPKIRKRVSYTRKFLVHDESEVSRLGDFVLITPCHRLSKRKHFLLREIIRSQGQL